MSDLDLADIRANLKRHMDRRDDAALAAWARAYGEELIESAEEAEGGCDLYDLW